MKNYKILENRAELSPKELTEGMNFTKIKTNAAAAAKVAVIKSIIIKTIFGACIITSSVLIYNYVSMPPTKNNTITLTDSIAKITEPNSKEVINEPIEKNSSKQEKEQKFVILTFPKTKTVHDTFQINANQTTTVAPTAIQTITIKKELVVDTVSVPLVLNTNTCAATITNTSKSIKNSKTTSCKIWHTSNFCSVPDTQDKYSIQCDACDYDYVSCKAANSENLVCVIVTLAAGGKQNLKIENKLKNITLTDAANHKSQTPTMIGIGSDNNFYGSNFKAKKFIVINNKQMNIYLFFKNAKVGDKIIINNFMEAIIEP